MLLGWRCWGCNEHVGSTSKVRDVMQWDAGSPCSDPGSAPVWASLGSRYGLVITISPDCEHPEFSWLFVGIFSWDTESLGVFLLLWILKLQRFAIEV